MRTPASTLRSSSTTSTDVGLEPGQPAVTRRVIGESGTIYELRGVLGRGGQGTVYHTQGESRVVKLVARRRMSHDQISARLAAVRRLGVHDLTIATPLELLRSPNIGYTMELLLGLQPIAALISPARGKALAEWYAETGGLRHRLRCLAETARLLAQLHGRGLVYGDLSHNNVMVPPPDGTGEVWLIDADNIRVSGESADAIVFTPPYGAPELHDGSPHTVDTDLHALAVLIFWSLSLIHPLTGDAVMDGPPEREVEAYQGRLPCVDDPADRTNASQAGQPRGTVMTETMRSLVQEAFSDGLHSPRSRPSAGAWYEALADAAGRIITCRNCDSGFFFDMSICPWCRAARPAHLQVARMVPLALRARDPRPHLVLGRGDHVLLDAGGSWLPPNAAHRAAVRLSDDADRDGGLAIRALNEYATSVYEARECRWGRFGQSKVNLEAIRAEAPIFRVERGDMPLVVLQLKATAG